MIQSIELIDKKSLCHALIASSISPEILIPIKGIVEDIHFNDKVPYYDIRVIKFYDNIDFLRKNMTDRPFLLKYRGKVTAITLPSNIKTAAALEDWFSEKSNYRFCVEAPFVTRTKNEMVDLFNKIQEYLIVQNLRTIRTASIRPLYTGHFRIDSKIEFRERLRRMIIDKFPNEDEFNRLSDSI